MTALSQQNEASIIDNKSSENDKIRENLQEKSKTNQMSETIWSTLRLALSYLNRSDLYTYCSNKDLNFLKSQFNI